MGIGYFIAFIQSQHDILMVPFDPLLDVPLEHPQLVQCHKNEIAGLDPRQILQIFHEHIG